MTNKLLLGRFRVGEQIGQGGMSRVYRAVDEQTGRIMAVKVLRDDLTADEEFIRRFEREAKAAATMDHENIVKLIDVGEQDGMRFMVMEYVAGITLKQLIAEYGRLGMEHTVAIAVQICRALEHAHAHKVIHRDVKPQNILVQEDGMIKVADFGIARTMNAETVTSTDVGILGSVHYISPEQARGGWIDEQSDVYSLGVVLYEMMAGDPPFDADTPFTIVLKHMQEEPRRPRLIYVDIPQAMEDVILRALEKDKAWRYGSIPEMERDLLRALAEPKGGFVKKKPVDDQTIRHKVLARPEDLRREPEKPARRKFHWGSVVVFVLLLAIVGLAGSEMGFDWFARTETVPNVMLIDEEAAVAAIAQQGLEPVIAYENTVEAEVGLVFRQTPKGGRRTSAGSLVQIVVSDGPPEVVVADLTMLSEAEARKSIEDLGLVLGKIDLDDNAPNIPKGRISRQSPRANDTALAGDAVDIWISDPPQTYAVPSVVGLLEEDAQAELVKKGFVKGATEIVGASNLPEGTVVRQEPADGATANVGTPVKLYIAGPTYAKEWKTNVTLSRDKQTVEVQQIDAYGASYVVHRATFSNSGTKELSITLTADRPGAQTLRVLVDGRLDHEEEIVFEDAS